MAAMAEAAVVVSGVALGVVPSLVAADRDACRCGQQLDMTSGEHCPRCGCPLDH